MSNQSTAGISPAADSESGLRLLALAAVAAGVILLAAAAFVLSYPGIHAVALSAGVSARPARLYPLIFDAMLIVACAAVLALRSAGRLSRCYAWLSLLVLLAAAATADALHASGVKLPHRPAAAVIAIIPWALVLIGFGLLLTMLRHARLRRTAVPAAQQQRALEPSARAQVRIGIDDLLGPRTFPGETGADQVPAQAGPAAGQAAAAVRPASGPVTLPDLPPGPAADPEPGRDDPARDEAGQAEPQPAARAARVTRIPRARKEPRSDGSGPAGSPAASPLSPAPLPAVFHYLGVRHEAAEPGPEDDASLEAGPAPDAGPELGTGPPPDARPELATGPPPDAEPDLDAEPTLNGESQAAAGSSHEPGSTPEPEPERETESQRAAGPAQPPLLQFDRMRSSPSPPGT